MIEEVGVRHEVFEVQGAVPIRVWAADAEDETMVQARNLARLPFAISHVAIMPDGHPGYGMPVGGVFFADKAVIPYAVGVDIGCGVTLIETNLYLDDLEDKKLEFLQQVSRDVPTGNGPHAQHSDPQGGITVIDELTINSDVLDVPGVSISDVAMGAALNADTQLGTLGGGNHFLELQYDAMNRRLNMMIHSGSRSVGKKICDYHHKVALELNRRWHSQLPDDELAYLPWSSDEAQAYWRDMTFAMLWAEENRRRMAQKVIEAFATVFSGTASQVLDVHHNYAAWENHMGRNGVVHRKGAIRARLGDEVLIPGSMGTASYVGQGLGNVLSFQSCQHGAGRPRSRGATRRMTSLEEMDKTLADAGVELVTRDRKSTIDESPMGYKDIEVVMAASQDLVKATRKLTPIGVVKG